MVREALLKFQSPSIRLWWVSTAGDMLTVRVSTNLPQSGREGGSQSGTFTLIGFRPRGSETKSLRYGYLCVWYGQSSKCFDWKNANQI